MDDKQNNVIVNLIFLGFCGFSLIYLFQSIIDKINYQKNQSLVKIQQVKADIDAIDQVQNQYEGKLITSQMLVSYELKHKSQITTHFDGLLKLESKTPIIQDGIIRTELDELKKAKLEELAISSGSEVDIPPMRTILFGAVSIFFTKIVSNFCDGFCGWIYPKLNKTIKGLCSFKKIINKKIVK